MARIISREGRRIYVETRYGEPVVERLKDLGAHWDRDRRAWWLGAGKAGAVEALLAETAATAPAGPVKDDPAAVRLVGKARYKGRTYYVRWAGITKRGGYAMRLVTLDQALDFWADGLDPAALLSDVTGARARQEQAEKDGLAVLVKTYPAREYRGRTEYTTLASIQRFIERERANRAAGGAVCAACGTSGDLVEDLEDGMMKHRGCCDIPSD